MGRIYTISNGTIFKGSSAPGLESSVYLLNDWLWKHSHYVVLTYLCLQGLQSERWLGIPCIINKGRDGVEGNMADSTDTFNYQLTPFHTQQL